MEDDPLRRTGIDFNEPEEQRQQAIYNPIIGMEREDEGINQKDWVQKQNLKSQSYGSTFRFFMKQSFKDVRRHKCQFWLGFWSVFVVVMMTLIINTLIDKGPIIFLRLAEGTVGETDAIIQSSANTDLESSKYLNMTQIFSIYNDEFLLSPRKIKDVEYRVLSSTPTNISNTTGLPQFTAAQARNYRFSTEQTQVLRVIDTEQEKKLKAGRDYSYDKLDQGEWMISTSLAGFKNLTIGDFLYMKFDIREELYIMWDHYLVRANDKTGYQPKIGETTTVCKIKDIFGSTSGKFPASEDDSTVIMEIEHFYAWVSAFVEPDDKNPSMVAFRSFLTNEFARGYDTADFIIMNFPDPRIDFYKESDYDDVQKNVVSYANTLVNKLGFFPASVKCALLEELQALSLGLVFLGIIFSVVSVLFIIISILLIYSLLMVTVEEKSFQIGIYRMVGLNKLGLVTMVLMQAFFFVIPAIIFSFLWAILFLWVIYRFIFDAAMGTVLLPLPTVASTFYALGVGILIPIVSSLYPMKIVLSKTLTDALDYSRSKTKAVFVEIIKAKDFDRKPYIIFGIISVMYGLSIYYFLPLALVSLNFSLLLTIFFMILIGMFVGMVLLALNLQRILEIVMVYLFLFYEKTSTRILVLKNLIAHKPRNRMTVAIYAMSIGFLIMIVVSYNLEITNAQALQRLQEGTYLSMDATGTTTIAPYEIEPKLKEIENLIEYHAFESHNLKFWYENLNTRDIFASDDQSLIQIPIDIYGVSPYHTQTQIQEYIIIEKENKTTGLSLSEQLYTARGSQGAGMGGYVRDWLGLSPTNWEKTFRTNLFTSKWNVYTTQRCLWSTKVMPGKQMSDRESNLNQMLISLPLLKKLLALEINYHYFPFEKVIVKLKEPENEDHISQAKIKLEEGSQGKRTTIYDSTSTEGSFGDAKVILDVVFNVIITSVMFLCFFSLSSSMTANMLEQRKEIGVLRAIGMRKARIYFLYMYECFILIFTGCMIGIMIGTLIGWTIMLQRVLFTNIPLSYYFPWIQVIVIFVVSVICAFLATVFPAYSILKGEISEIFRSG